MRLYHGSGETVEFPEVRRGRFTKDFSWGFYCTIKKEQAERWTEKWINTDKIPTVNHYNYTRNEELKILKFTKMTDEWLDFIAECRAGKIHDYDIVEGPMTDDVVWNFVTDFLSGKFSRRAFWELAKFQYPTHQISFHTLRALSCLEFEGSEVVSWKIK